jgi:hypothetical protein
MFSTDASLSILDVIEDIGVKDFLQLEKEGSVVEAFNGAVEVKVPISDVPMTNHDGLVTYQSLGRLNKVGKVLRLQTNVEFQSLD